MGYHTDEARAVAEGSSWKLDATSDARGWSGVGVASFLGYTRDSDALDESNFLVALTTLKARFHDRVDSVELGHWAVGWVKWLIYDPADADVAAAIADLRTRLADYPVLDDDDFSEREYARNHPGDGRCYDEDPDCSCGYQRVA